MIDSVVPRSFQYKKPRRVDRFTHSLKNRRREAVFQIMKLVISVTYASTKIVSRLIQKRELVEISHASTKQLRRLTKNGYVD